MSSGFPIFINQASAVGPLEYVCPVNQVWQFMFGHCVFTTSATGGNRQLALFCKNADGIIVWDSHAGPKQTSSVERQYNFRRGGAREATFYDNDIVLTVPDKNVILPGWTLVLEDHDAVDEAADLYTFHATIFKTTGASFSKDSFI